MHRLCLFRKALFRISKRHVHTLMLSSKEFSQIPLFPIGLAYSESPYAVNTRKSLYSGFQS